MCTPCGDGFVSSGRARSERPHLENPPRKPGRMGKQLERSIDRGVADARILLLDKTVTFFGAEVVVRLQKHPEDAISLGALVEASLA
jgi:hypothetical protein